MKYTPEQFNEEIKRRFNQIRKAEVIYPIATKVHADMTERIFSEGINGNGQKIGEYSTESAYFTKKQFKKTSAFKGRGKNSNSPKFKDGTARKSMFIADGYKGLKSVQGYVSAFVNLTYSSTLRNGFASGLAENGGAIVLRLINKENQKKLEWLKEKYGPATFKHTKEEREFFKKELTKDLISILSGGNGSKLS